MYDDFITRNKTLFTDSIIESIKGEVFVILSADMMPWFVINRGIQKASWVASFNLPTKRFAMETILHSKAGFSMPRPLPSIRGIVNPMFDDPSMVIYEAKVGFIKTYLTWADALQADPDEIYGIGLTFSLWSPIIGIGDIYLQEIEKNNISYRFDIGYQFNESVPFIDALAEFIVKKDDDDSEGGLV